MTKKKPNRNNAPFRLKSGIKFYYQGHFLYYTNELVPELSAELKKLTSRCKKLFGKFPVSIPTVNDTKKFGVWFNRPFYDVEKDKPWRKIENIFYDCIWEGSRDEAGRDWFKFLRDNNEDLNKILEFEENRRKVIFQYIESSLTAEQLNLFRDVCAPYYTKPKESLTIQDLQHTSLQLMEDHCRKTDENYVKMMKSKDSKLEPLIEFQKDFDSLLKKFCLGKKWLAESVFRAIWNGTGKLQMEITFYENTSQEIFHEIHDRLKPKKITRTENEMMDKYDKFYVNNIPLPNPFQYPAPYHIIPPIEDYEENAIAAYRQHLHDYFKIIKESFRKFGYKQPYQHYQYDRVMWLVWWNIKYWTKDQILQEIANTTDKFLTLDTIDKAFRKFKEYDLPVRQ